MRRSRKPVWAQVHRGFESPPLRQPCRDSVVNVAYGLAREIGVSQPLWTDACSGMGRPLTALCVLIVAAKYQIGESASPVGIFAGCSASAMKEC